MDPIFEVPSGGPIDEVRVGDNVFPAKRLRERRGEEFVDFHVVEATSALGELHGWTRRFDLEAERKRRYQAMGERFAEEMQAAEQQLQADATERDEQAQLEAERQAREEAEQSELLARLEAQGDSNADVAPTASEEAPAAAATEDAQPAAPAPAESGKKKRGGR